MCGCAVAVNDQSPSRRSPLTVNVPIDIRQKGQLKRVVHSVAYFFWLVKNLKYTIPQGSIPSFSLAATSLSCNIQQHPQSQD